VNWAQATSLHQRGGVSHTGDYATCRTSGTGRTGREFWIVNWAQATSLRQRGTRKWYWKSYKKLFKERT